MKINEIIHEKVKRDGTFENEEGAVETDGGIRMNASYRRDCGLEDCHCADGYWITIMLPRDSWGKVHGMQVQFDNKKEYDRFIKFGEARL